MRERGRGGVEAWLKVRERRVQKREGGRVQEGGWEKRESRREGGRGASQRYIYVTESEGEESPRERCWWPGGRVGESGRGENRSQE